MDKRIAIGLMAALLLLVVTAAYAPNTGTVTTDDKAVSDEQVSLKALETKLNTVLDNQKLILEEIRALKTGQADLIKDVKYIRSKTR